MTKYSICCEPGMFVDNVSGTCINSNRYFVSIPDWENLLTRSKNYSEKFWKIMGNKTMFWVRNTSLNPGNMLISKAKGTLFGIVSSSEKAII